MPWASVSCWWSKTRVTRWRQPAAVMCCRPARSSLPAPALHCGRMSACVRHISVVPSIGRQGSRSPVSPEDSSDECVQCPRADRRRQDGRQGDLPGSVSYATTLVLDDFERVPHELLAVPQSSTAYVPIYGDGIHGRNPNPGHLLSVIDLEKRAHVGDIDLSPFESPHGLQIGPDGLLYIT